MICLGDSPLLKESRLATKAETNSGRFSASDPIVCFVIAALSFASKDTLDEAVAPSLLKVQSLASIRSSHEKAEPGSLAHAVAASMTMSIHCRNSAACLGSDGILMSSPCCFFFRPRTSDSDV